MPQAHTAAFDAIQVFIRSLLPRAETTHVGDEQLRVRNGAESLLLSFTREQLEDLDVVMQGNLPVRYSTGMKDDVYFQIYVALGVEGMIPDVRIFGVLLNQEDRDWLNRCRLETRFTAEEAKQLYDGLIELQSSLRSTLKSGLEVPEVQAELNHVEFLTRYYETLHHLDENDASAQSLAYLKAAALCWMLRLWKAKSTEPSTRAKRAYDRKIYALVHDFWVKAPYNRIKLPLAIHDLVAQRNRSAPPEKPVQQAQFDIGPLLDKLDARLKNRWRGAWIALDSENPDRVSQATNSMVEVLDQVIDRVRGAEEFKDHLAGRFPLHAEAVLATRTWISKIKASLNGVKHHTDEQPPELAEALMRQAEGIIKLLLS